MNGPHLELILETHPGANRSELEESLRAKGLEPLPMKSGVLLAGPVDALRQAVPTLTAEQTGQVPVPAELSRHVRSIRVFGPRRLQSP
jgi:hypothetical protein